MQKIFIRILWIAIIKLYGPNSMRICWNSFKFLKNGYKQINEIKYVPSVIDSLIVLGIETTCDETSCGILKFYPSKKREKSKLPYFEELSCVVLSQDFHYVYGGVVPELASREHVRNIVPVFDSALKQAGLSPQDIDLVAVAGEPGLPGSLFVGVNFAKGVAQALSKKFTMINHVEAHLLSPLIEEDFAFPFFSLIVSGGHSSFYYVEGIGKYRLLLRTLDDAVGEAFDKLAKFFRFGYPGGPIIDSLSKGAQSIFSFPKVESNNFSFSGLKTFSTRTALKWLGGFPLPEFFASFQTSLISDIIEKVLSTVLKIIDSAEWEQNKKEVIISVGGGVARNSFFRKIAQDVLCGETKFRFIFPSPKYCVDNGSMVAFLGGLRFLLFGEESKLDTEIKPTGILKSKGGIEN